MWCHITDKTNAFPVQSINLSAKNLEVCTESLAKVDFLLEQFSDFVGGRKEIEAAEATLLGDNSLQVGNWSHEDKECEDEHPAKIKYLL